MRMLLLSAALAALTGTGAGFAAEKVAEELAGLRKEVADLRAEVGKLVARQDDQTVMLGQLLEAAKALKAAGKLEEGELAVISLAIRKGGEAGSRAMGLLGRLPQEQKCAVLGRLIGDFQVQVATREALLRSLSAEGGDAARQAVREAIERERLLPAARPAGYGPAHYAFQDFRLPLAVAAGELKEKAAVDLTLEYLEDTAQAATAMLAERKRVWGGRGPGMAVYGNVRTLIWRLRAWSGVAGLEQFVTGEQRWGYVMIDSDEKLDGFKKELAAAQKWWQENREKFEFPAQTPEPPAQAAPAGPGHQPEIMQPPRKPVEQF